MISCQDVMGFNYQPSYGTNGFELWQKFDASTIELELGRGKKYFPKMNAIRLWLSFQSFKRGPERFQDCFESALAIADDCDLLVMPVLFNRWHDCLLDYGGVYVDHFLPEVSWVQGEDQFAPFVEAIVGPHVGDERILAWDLCNEPFSYLCELEQIPEIVDAEFTWLEGLYRKCKDMGTQAPITVGIHSGHEMDGIRQIEPISDILSIHPYWTDDSPPHTKDDYERLLDQYVEFSEKVNKPLLATETCWGSTDDEQRVEIIRYTLTQLKKRGIGWLVYLLHHSLIADAHREEYGPVGEPGNLSFIEADGSLRPGHELWNEF